MTGYINSLISTVLVQGNPLHCDVSRIIINWDMINNICTSYKNEMCDKVMMVLIFCNQCSRSVKLSLVSVLELVLL